MRATTRMLLTIGYEGATVSEFIAKLRSGRVSRLIDVRQLPLSRRRGFSKTALAAALRDAGIEYVHVRSAGNPFRHVARDDVQECLRLYRSHLAQSPEVIAELMRAVGLRRSALMCMEAGAEGCHRSPLAEALASAAGYSVQHL